MVHFLRYVSVNLWIAVLAAGFASLILLPPLQAKIPPTALPYIVGLLEAVFFAAVLWSANRLGRRRVRRWMQDADRAARTGLRADAEMAYQAAWKSFDSFLISPAERRTGRPRLAARMARFYLAQDRLGAAAAVFVAAYLGSQPRDEEVAELWLRQLSRQGGLREEHQEVAERLGGAHPLNSYIQYEVARLYLALERTDFLALQCYRRVCAGGLLLPAGFGPELARLLQRAGRRDEWAEKLFQQAGVVLPESVAERLPAPERVADKEDRPRLEEADDAAEDWGQPFRISDVAEELEEEETAPGGLWVDSRHTLSAWHRLKSWSTRAARASYRVVEDLGRAGVRRLGVAWQRPAVRQALAGGLIAGVAVGGLWMLADRYGLFSPAPPAPPPSMTAVVPAARQPDPYTLQVAAYLKHEYALHCMEDLKKNGLDAYWITTEAGGKTWYQVRISHFADQQSAREYGRVLKDKGLIEDFYVARYVR